MINAYAYSEDEPFTVVVEYEDGRYDVIKGAYEYGIEMQNGFNNYYIARGNHKIAINPAKIRAIGLEEDFGK